MEIRRLVVHGVDHWSATKPLLSDLESPLTEEVDSFLRQHISTHREHKRARTARFLEPPGAQSFAALCDGLLSGTQSFVQLSQEVARKLFDVMEGDDRISPGTLVLCTFVDAASEDGEWLGLFKLDPEDGFMGEPEAVDGQTRIVLQPVSGVVPTGKIQKCALVLPERLRQREGHDLIVLDQQVGRYGITKQVASFFLTRFLECEIGYQNADRTRQFVLLSQEWIVSKRGSWSTQRTAEFERKVLEAIRADVVDVAAFAEAMLSDPEDHAGYLEHLKEKGLHEFTFESDPDERRRWTQFVSFKGDDGLELKVKLAALEEGRLVSHRFDEATNTNIITIRTTNWEQVLKRGK